MAGRFPAAWGIPSLIPRLPIPAPWGGEIQAARPIRFNNAKSIKKL